MRIENIDQVEMNVADAGASADTIARQKLHFSIGELAISNIYIASPSPRDAVFSDRKLFNVVQINKRAIRSFV